LKLNGNDLVGVWKDSVATQLILKHEVDRVVVLVIERDEVCGVHLDVIAAVAADIAAIIHIDVIIVVIVGGFLGRSDNFDWKQYVLVLVELHLFLLFLARRSLQTSIRA